MFNFALSLVSNLLEVFRLKLEEIQVHLQTYNTKINILMFDYTCTHISIPFQCEEKFDFNTPVILSLIGQSPLPTDAGSGPHQQTTNAGSGPHQQTTIAGTVLVSSKV